MLPLQDKVLNLSKIVVIIDFNSFVALLDLFHIQKQNLVAKDSLRNHMNDYPTRNPSVLSGIG